jgi:hypothetical protein
MVGCWLRTPLPAGGERESFAAAAESQFTASRWQPGAGRRAFFAGLAWGVPMAAILVSLEVWRCGVLCLTEAAVTLAVATITGIATIGVFAALFGGTATGSSRRNLSQKGTSWLASSS